MNITTEELYKSILYWAADIYEVEYDDVERDVGQQFDPIIRFMSGALASELERVYQNLNDTERRLQKRLAKVLLPEYFHLPQPAHALVVGNANSESFVIDETTEFLVEQESEKEDIAFSPLVPTRILPIEIKVIATENQILDTKKRLRNLKKKSPRKKSEIRKIAIGFESAEPIVDWAGATLFFDLKGKSATESEKALFFAALPNSQCKFHGEALNLRSGLPQRATILEDYLNGNERLQKTVCARYEHHFLNFTDLDIPEPSPVDPHVFLSNWFANSVSTPEELQAKLSKLNAELDKPLYWLEIQLSKSVEISRIEERLAVKLNVFPVVNRRLNGHGRGEHHYFRSNSIKWVSLQPKEDFLSVRRVYEIKPPENPLFTFKPFAEFKEERKPSYTLRQGGVGRWDDFNAWQRLSYVVNVLQDNYKHEDLIEAAAGALSLEDVHHLLGKRISKTAQEEKPTRDVYVLLHAGVSSNLQVRVEYWTSIGDEANNLSIKSVIKCISKRKSDFDSESLALLTSPTDGRAPLNSTQQITAMKSALLSRGRIVTREDVKIFCKSFLHEKISEVDVKDGVGTDPRDDFGMTRILEVFLKPSKKYQREDWEGICQQLQVLLEQKSTSSIPIKVSYKLDSK